MAETSKYENYKEVCVSKAHHIRIPLRLLLTSHSNRRLYRSCCWCSIKSHCCGKKWELSIKTCYVNVAKMSWTDLNWTILSFNVMNRPLICVSFGTNCLLHTPKFRSFQWLWGYEKNMSNSQYEKWNMNECLPALHVSSFMGTNFQISSLTNTIPLRIVSLHYFPGCSETLRCTPAELAEDLTGVGGYDGAALVGPICGFFNADKWCKKTGSVLWNCFHHSGCAVSQPNVSLFTPPPPSFTKCPSLFLLHSSRLITHFNELNY